MSDYEKNKNRYITLLTLANRYLNKVNQMEEQADEEFTTLINSFEEELKKYSYDTDIIQEVENYYKEFKEELRTQIYSKAREHM